MICTMNKFERVKTKNIFIPLLTLLKNHGFNVKIHVLCSGSLGKVTKDCTESVQKLNENRATSKLY